MQPRSPQVDTTVQRRMHTSVHVYAHTDTGMNERTDTRTLRRLTWPVGSAVIAVVRQGLDDAGVLDVNHVGSSAAPVPRVELREGVGTRGRENRSLVAGPAQVLG